ncbi:flagellar biosynthesis anti-sigma factor FlgM [Allosphingosinicella vermicomposti]|uniref:flagellar biosynthesis anti-sigma factor FlgM n=1 Tax=Allosphingosinicella vermicomposti TaxID=614671 RepID=UPI000D10D009|nr:flagellar biosynthesis anti-sigma factor FlgM [Allosphingosinicella vermicomposti]
MIDGIGKGGLGRIDIQRGQVAKSGAASSAGSATSGSAASGSASLLADLASGPPVNAEKIAALRAAIAEGRYPVDPEKIAERMIALDIPYRDAQ